MEADRVDVTMEMVAGISESSVDEALSAVVGSELLEEWWTSRGTVGTR